jgi:YgiT-type zinc finger domain-containing protein
MKKCVCGNKLQIIKSEMSFFNGKIIIKNINAFYCNKCKEKFFDSKEGDKLQCLVTRLKKKLKHFEGMIFYG